MNEMSSCGWDAEHLGIILEYLKWDELRGSVTTNLQESDGQEMTGVLL